jgi:anthranilate synthase component I
MYYPDKKEFIKLSGKGNVIPVYKELLMDFDTPLAAFLKIDEGNYSYILESVEGGERLGRFTFLGSNPSMVIESTGRKMSITRDGVLETFETETDPIDEIKKIMSEYKFVAIPGLPRICGGLVGYIGYDMVRFFEDIPDKNQSDMDLADMQFILTDTILIFDHVDRKIKVLSNAIVEDDVDKAYSVACDKIDAIIEKLRKPFDFPAVKKVQPSQQAETSNFSSGEFCEIVEKAKEHIRCGDVIQVVLSQQISRTTEQDAFTIYRALRSINPSPYMYYLKFGNSRIVGSSPEILVRSEDGVVEVRPIAGTRPRGKDAEEDSRLEEELLDDPKERAEHIMLVDLGRNDIGRVCEYSSVKPVELMKIERYSHVMHIVSDVTGTLKEDKDIFDLIRATFPAGTVTGAPKVKAMELIDKYENKRRGIYAGCLGYISFSGNTDLCITIRTIVMSGKTAHIQAGAGIVLDSDPEKEYQETRNKARAMVKAIEFAENGLE